MFIVVTLFAAWLGWNVSIVNARRTLRQSALKDATFIRPVLNVQVAPAKTPELSIWRKWLGDEPTELLRLRTKTEADRAKTLFPEATIYYLDDRPRSDQTWPLNHGSDQEPNRRIGS
jgi:hypothetical protein